MKLHSVISAATASAFVLLVACGSSKNGSSGGTSFKSCQGATTSTGMGSTACSNCLEGTCGSELSSAESGCQDYFNCYSGCSCSDINCISGCITKAEESSCTSAFESLTNCLTGSCASQCNASTGTTDGG